MWQPDALLRPALAGSLPGSAETPAVTLLDRLPRPAGVAQGFGALKRAPLEPVGFDPLPSSGSAAPGPRAERDSRRDGPQAPEPKGWTVRKVQTILRCPAWPPPSPCDR